MLNWIKDLDRILRGEATRLSALERGAVDVAPVGLGVVIVVLGMIYGACMGTFALLHDDGPRYEQLLATTLKVPALFILTLLVTFPSLYVFNALVGSRLNVVAVLRLLIASLGVNLAVLASLGTIVAFFSVSTPNYGFMVLLNVVVFAVAGLLGLNFLLQTLHRLSVAQQRAARTPQPAAPTAPLPVSAPLPLSADDATQELETIAVEAVEEAHTEMRSPDMRSAVMRTADARGVEPPGALDRLDQPAISTPVKLVFRCWVIVFGLVGAQMGWVLRPFIGDPDSAFMWFRPRDSNFLQAVWNAFLGMFS